MLFLSVFFISLALLSYEIFLMRAFSIASWSHFAYMAISIALLGCGASGTFITIFQKRLRENFPAAFSVFSFLLSLSIFFSFATIQKIPFEPLQIVWYGRQYGYLLSEYLVLFLPFFLGATCIGLSFQHLPGKINKIYFSNMAGSGAGALLIVLLMFLLSPRHLLVVIVLFSFLATIIFALSLKTRWSPVIVISSLIMALFFFFSPPEMRISPYKSLSTTLKLPQAKILTQRFSPYGLLTVVESPAIRYAPGLSLNFTGELPPQLALFIDGDSQCAITRFTGDLAEFEYLDYMTSALPYHLLEEPRVLILGSGGGSEVLSALYHQAGFTEAVEVNSQIIDLAKEDFSDFSGNIYSRADVQAVVAEARGFVESRTDKYDLIQLSLLDSFSASSAGVYALSESYLYTREAFQHFLEALSSGGIISVTRWIKMPPRDGIKMFATAVEALEKMGVKEAASHLIFIRNWATSTLLIGSSPFSEGEIWAAREFAGQRGFDLIWYPGISLRETNRYHILPQPYYYDACRSILSSEREKFYDDYLFYVQPARDNSPYFFCFFKWKSLPHLIKTMGKEWMPFIEWGYVVLIATLLQASLISFLLILLPLFFLRRQKIPGFERIRVFLYFLFLGIAYMFIEMSFIQRFVLFLRTPIYAVSVVIFSFLLFSGWGSLFSQRIKTRRFSGIAISVAGIVVISLVYLGGLKTVFSSFSSASDGIRIAISVALIAPLAFFMGIPFPLGLTRVAREFPSHLPWAWGINGCFSVIGAVLATTLAISSGFSLVTGLALCLYAGALLVLR